MLAATDPDWMTQVIGPFGALVLCLLALFGIIIKGWLVPGWVHRDVVRQRDLYMDLALKGVSAAEPTAHVAARVAEKANGGA